MRSDVPAAIEVQGEELSFDGPVGRRIIDTHMWAVREGLRGASAYDLFDGYCQRLVTHGVPLWRAHVAMETLHPQWGGYGFTWRRDLNAIHPEHMRAATMLARTGWAVRCTNSSAGRAQANPIPRCAGASKKARSSGIFRCSHNSFPREQPTILARFLRSARRAILHRGPEWFIPSRPTGAAASVTTIPLLWRRRCPRCRWR